MLWAEDGELTYGRNTAEGRCIYTATLTGVASVENCEAGCMFGREMVLSNVVYESPEASDCTADDFGLEGDQILFGSIRYLSGRFSGNAIYALQKFQEGAWEVYPDAYSIVFGDLNTGAWYFGVAND